MLELPRPMMTGELAGELSSVFGAVEVAMRALAAGRAGVGLAVSLMPRERRLMTWTPG